MALLDKPATHIPSDQSFDEEIRALKAQKIRAIRSIGETFISENEGKDMTGTKYEEFFRILEENKKSFEDVENRQLAARGLKKCVACGTELPLATAFCNNCGAKQPDTQPAQPAPVTQCPNCGAALDDDVVFCANCGTKVR